MARYEYKNEAGEVREVVGSMQNPPPEEIIIFASGNWIPVGAVIEGADLIAEIAKTPKDRRTWTRVYGGGVGVHVPDLAVRRKDGGLPVSMAAPRRRGGKLEKRGDHVVRVHDDGIITNTAGQPVVDSNDQCRRVAKATGMEID